MECDYEKVLKINAFIDWNFRDSDSFQQEVQWHLALEHLQNEELINLQITYDTDSFTRSPFLFIHIYKAKRAYGIKLNSRCVSSPLCAFINSNVEYLKLFFMKMHLN
jgi:hypothetical protein